MDSMSMTQIAWLALALILALAVYGASKSPDEKPKGPRALDEDDFDDD